LSEEEEDQPDDSGGNDSDVDHPAAFWFPPAFAHGDDKGYITESIDYDEQRHEGHNEIMPGHAEAPPPGYKL
jgi:hypothetical protein